MPERVKGAAIGIDLGTTYSCVAVWFHKKNRVKIIPNEQGNNTPSCVAFNDIEILVGEGVKNQIARNPTDTVFDLKRLIGSRFKDLQVQKDKENGYCKNHEKRAKTRAITDTRTERFMRTRNSYFPNNLSATISIRRNKRRTPNVVEPELRTIVEMTDNRTMEELLQAPSEGYGKAIVIPEINADHFEIKTNLLQLVHANPYHGFERENPHTHINNFKRITSTLKFRDVPNDEMLRACPHHEFTELAQIDNFYNGLNDNDQDSLNAAAGGNLLSKTTREALQIIENKSKVCYSRNKPNVSRMNMTSRDNASRSDDRIDKLADQISTLVDIFAKKIVSPAPVKAVEESCVTCGGNHAYYNCPNTDSNQPSVCVATGTYNQVAPQNRASNYMAPPGFAPVQNGQNRFNQNLGQVPNNSIQQGFPNEFLNYKKVNDQMMRKTQNQINYLKEEFKNEIQNTMKTQQTVLMEQQNAFQNNLQNMLSGFFQNQSSTLGTLSSNTIPNPKGEMKAITTRSGVAYEGPSIPTPKKAVEQETEETSDKEQSNFRGSNAHIQPPAIPIPEPDATNQMEKFFQIFKDLHIDISFADALLLMPKFASTIKSLLTNKDILFELAKIPLNENCLVMLLKKLLEKLGDPGCDLLALVELFNPVESNTGGRVILLFFVLPKVFDLLALVVSVTLIEVNKGFLASLVLRESVYLGILLEDVI
nr:heat shock cognate 70 kDa protein-like [Tanacetum cinerariifolium]